MAVAQRVATLYLQDVQGLAADTLREMMEIGTVEIVVDVKQAVAWGAPWAVSSTNSSAISTAGATPCATRR
jgi:hypothetical protein